MERRSPHIERQLKTLFIDHWRHYRHDMLNHIQLIKSYLQLDRVNDARRTIDQLVLQTKQEALLSQLGDPELAYLLLTYNYQSRALHLDVEVHLPQDRLSAIDAQACVTPLIEEIVRLIEKESQQQNENSKKAILYLILDGDDNHFLIEVEVESERIGQVALNDLKDSVIRLQGKLETTTDRDGQLLMRIKLPWNGTQSHPQRLNN